MPKSRKRKGAKKPKKIPLIRRIGDKKYVQLLDEHGELRTHELPEVKKK